MNGSELHAFASRLYPICRSITGRGVRETLALIGQHIPLRLHEVPSGSAVYDWEVPLEWNVDDAFILSPDGQRIVDFQAHNLHLVSYSEPTVGTFSLPDLAPRLHSIPGRPEWIPYRTSHYRRDWGFCLADRVRQSLVPGDYRVEIQTSLAEGSLSYGECLVPGRIADEIVFFTHVCHPSLANDNTSGMAVATALAKWVADSPRRYSYRFVFAPGTIGSLCWLKANEAGLGRIRGGLVLALLGDAAPLTYKRSRDGATANDEVAEFSCRESDEATRVIDFSPYGYDERQLCSPGFNLPIGRLTRSVNGGFPQYHSSADDMTLVEPGSLERSLAACQHYVRVLEENTTYTNLSPYGEPRLGARGLYSNVGGSSPPEHQEAMLWVLNQSDGTRSLLQIAQRSGMAFGTIRDAAAALAGAGLLRAGDAGASSVDASIRRS